MAFNQKQKTKGWTMTICQNCDGVPTPPSKRITIIKFRKFDAKFTKTWEPRKQKPKYRWSTIRKGQAYICRCCGSVVRDGVTYKNLKAAYPTNLMQKIFRAGKKPVTEGA